MSIHQHYRIKLWSFAFMIGLLEMIAFLILFSFGFRGNLIRTLVVDGIIIGIVGTGAIYLGLHKFRICIDHLEWSLTDLKLFPLVLAGMGGLLFIWLFSFFFIYPFESRLGIYGVAAMGWVAAFIPAFVLILFYNRSTLLRVRLLSTGSHESKVVRWLHPGFSVFVGIYEMLFAYCQETILPVDVRLLKSFYQSSFFTVLAIQALLWFFSGFSCAMITGLCFNFLNKLTVNMCKIERAR